MKRNGAPAAALALLLIMLLAFALAAAGCGAQEASDNGAAAADAEGGPDGAGDQIAEGSGDAAEEADPHPDIITPGAAMWVRTPATIYENESDARIAGYASKGTELMLLDYDYTGEDGSVNMYKVVWTNSPAFVSDDQAEENAGEAAQGGAQDANTGWVYAKYLADNATDAGYNNELYTTLHRGRTYYGRDLYGGDPAALDYYPVEKPAFEDNPLLEDANAMFMTFWCIWDLEDYLQVARENGVNAIVLDIKNTTPAYKSDVCAEYCPTAYENAFASVEDYKWAVDTIKNEGFYLIGRIVTFNDEFYAADHPEAVITSSASNSKWPSAFDRGAWEYNVQLAVEAVRMFGFDEIQFDYVRFPSNAYRLSKASNTDFRNMYGESMSQAIQNFLFYACDQIHKEHAYVSADVFGECSSAYVSAYGQYWPAISNVVDVTSSMPYTDHFGDNSSFWKNPYTTVHTWALETAQRQKEIPTPSIARTWITCYDTPYWGPDTRCDAEYLHTQMQALKDAGLTGGSMAWNGNCSIAKYREVAPAWKQYAEEMTAEAGNEIQ